MQVGVWCSGITTCCLGLTVFCAQQISTLMLEREKAVEHKNRMSRMVEDRDTFVSKLMSARRSVYEVSLAAAEICSLIAMSFPLCTIRNLW